MLVVKISTIVLTLFCFVQLAEAQSNFSISGKVTDDQGMAVELATIALRMPNDSTTLAGAFTEADGSFQFNDLSANTYLLEISYVGFEKQVSNPVVLNKNNPNVKIPTIQLNPDPALLKEVTVTAKAPYVTRLADRTVVNPDALIANAGSSALEALERSPGVSVDASGTIKLKGRSGVQVFIDDKPTYLSGQELESYLRSLPASTIKQIELMTNPPAKYEAAGNSGIINIVTKRNKQPGFNGNVVGNFQRGKYSRTNNSLNLNLTRKKFSLYTNLNYGLRNSFQDLNINRYYKNPDLSPLSSFSQNSYIVKQNESGMAKLGLDYYISDKTTLGLVVKGFTAPDENDTDNFAARLNANKDTLQTIKADNFSKGTFRNGAYNLNLRHNLDSLGSNIVVDADYVTYVSGSDQFFQNFFYDPNGSLTYADSINGRLPSNITIYAGKADYTKPFANGLKLEAGWKSAYTKTDNEAAYTNTLNGETTKDYNLSNRFLYDEWIHAAYVNFTKRLGHFDLQLGLRVENTQLKGNQLGNELQPEQKFSRSYTQPFPTFYATWHLDSLDNNLLNFSYGRRIDRPYFQDLNPFVSPLDKFTFYTGNPGLLPTYSHNLSLSHTFKGKLTTTLNYSKTVDGINETLEIEDGIYYSRPGNIANSEDISLSLEINMPIGKWYTLNSYMAAGHSSYKSKLYTQQLDANGNYGYVSVNNGFQLGNGWAAELRGEYQTDVIYSQLLIKSYGVLNCAFSKKILKDAGILKLSFSDILYTRRADGIIRNLELTDADWNSDLDTRAAMLTFSYRFGKAANQRERHTGNGSESEQQRVKG